MTDVDTCSQFVSSRLSEARMTFLFTFVAITNTPCSLFGGVTNCNSDSKCIWACNLFKCEYICGWDGKRLSELRGWVCVGLSSRTFETRYITQCAHPCVFNLICESAFLCRYVSTCFWASVCECVARGNLSCTWKPHCLFMPTKLKCASPYSLRSVPKRIRGKSVKKRIERVKRERKRQERWRGKAESLDSFSLGCTSAGLAIERIMRPICPY